MKARLGKWLYAFFILFSVATVVFWLFRFSFKNAEEMLLGQQADEATRESIKKELGLDQKPGMQYLYFLRDLSPISWHPVGEIPDVPHLSIKIRQAELVLKLPYLRRSFISKRLVSELLAEAFGSTAILAALSMFLATIFWCGGRNDSSCLQRSLAG